MTRYAIVTREFTFEVSDLMSESHEKPPQTYRLQIAQRCPVPEERGQTDDGIDVLKQTVNLLLFASVSGDSMNQNDLDTLSGTTTPHLVHWIWDALVAAGVPDDQIVRVRLWETEQGYTEITHQERDNTVYSGFEA